MGNESASNYSVQPGKSIDYPNYGHAMDVKDHPTNTVPQATEHYDGNQLRLESSFKSLVPVSKASE